ncbi:MAG: hypothetical protein E7109_05665 [Bacteroidales bacterium]|jgi:sigma-E factor negative regulatory protein RseC|nr:hypothetical protein [Bacteroidales bacterium]
MKKETISHKGKIVNMTPQVTTVSILQHAACGECHAAGICGMGDMAEKLVEVPTDPYGNYSVGDEVEVLLKASMGLKAVWLCYAIPLVVLLGTVVGLLSAGVEEAAAGLVGLAAIGLYYLLLYLFRNKLKNEYIFTIQ